MNGCLCRYNGTRVCPVHDLEDDPFEFGECGWCGDPVPEERETHGTCSPECARKEASFGVPQVSTILSNLDAMRRAEGGFARGDEIL